jgi:Zn finger protein HypA/HybF involved in hydrogenase expression
MNAQEFAEIAHTGGKVTFIVTTGEDGRRRFSVRVSHERSSAAAWFSVFAIWPGVVVAPYPMVGIGAPGPSAPMPGCYPVFIASDSEGMFGHQCPSCSKYWRAKGSSQVCPYCGLQDDSINFLTDAQRKWVREYVETLHEVLTKGEDGNYEIDMDAVADAVGSKLEKPPFYYSEERQQTHFRCRACNQTSDILGRYGYCSVCGTRNDLDEVEKDIARLRERINADNRSYEAVAKDAVGLFDSSVGHYVRQLTRGVPMTPGRVRRLERMRFHDLPAVHEELKGTFDIDILQGIDAQDVAFGKLMFHRRHVYEHNGGEADAKYIADSGDNSVREKQHLHETQESAHRIAGLVQRMLTNLHRAFHEIIPSIAEPIENHKKHQEMMAGYRNL